MEGFSKVVESAQLPLDIPIRPSLKDHCFNGRVVLPAVEAMEILAQAVRRFRRAADVTSISEARFEKFLYLDPGIDRLAAIGEISVLGTGDITAVLTTKTKSKNAIMARIKVHAALTFACRAAPMPDVHLDLTSNPQGVSFFVDREKLYPELVSFGPFYRNVIGLRMTPTYAAAEIRNPAVADAGAAHSNRLGSPFALDSAFHVACVWGQRFAGVVAFPVGIDRRRIYTPTAPAETYIVHVRPVRADPNLLIFDLGIFDRAERLYEACSGVRMRDVSGGKMRPPEWIKPKCDR
jgi:hypothetical protein